MEMRLFELWQARDGKVARYRVFLSEQEALEAMGCRIKTLTATPEAAGYCAERARASRTGGDRVSARSSRNRMEATSP